jgi:pyruvate dehydrogenase E1 component
MTVQGRIAASAEHPVAADPARQLDLLHAMERKLLWLSAWMIHHANHVRPNRDGLKVGGHQASCASVISIMTALYFVILRPQDRLAVKPHAGPVFHAVNWLFGRQSRDKLETLRQFGGIQPYPSRVRDGAEVDFSTGSVGLGVALTSFGALVEDYVRLHGLGRADIPQGRHIAIVGDAELDEGNIYEALLEGWKHDVRNVWWIIDYNRQSLDSVVQDRLFGRIEGLFRDMGWNVVTLKYGRKLEAAFAREGGESLRRWIDDCPNSLYSALTFQGGAAWRNALLAELGREPGLRAIIDPLSDDELGALMTNLGGHDVATLLEAFRTQDAAGDQPTCFIAYTVKGMGLPFAGHKDNHAGLMTKEQMQGFKAEMRIRDGHEWDRFEGLDLPEAELQAFLGSVPFATPIAPEGRRLKAAPVAVPDAGFPRPKVAPGRKFSTQQAFGEVLAELGRGQGEAAAIAKRIVTTSPDVTVSTNLGPWVNRRGVFDRHLKNDVFRDAKLASAQRWGMSPEGQHIELGIAEQNLFLLMSALGLAHDLYGARLLPIGTVYDPFVNRGLDALIYACYQDARFMLVSTPSGLTLAPEGGQHQSINTPLLGMAQDRLASFEPAYADELAILMRWGFEHMQKPDGSAVWLRLSTRGLEQPQRVLDPAAVVAGGHWMVPPAPGARIAIAYQGPVAPEALAAFEELRTEEPGAGLLAITSPDRLHAEWLAARRKARAGFGAPSWVEELLAPLAPDAAIVSVLDGHPAAHAWLGAVRGQRVVPLGVDHFGQAGDIPDLYREYGLDVDAILDACAQALLG